MQLGQSLRAQLRQLGGTPVARTFERHRRLALHAAGRAAGSTAFPFSLGRRWPAGPDEGDARCRTGSRPRPVCGLDREWYPVAGRACSYRGSVVPVCRGQHRFSLLSPGEGGPQGRMRVIRGAGPVRGQGRGAGPVRGQGLCAVLTANGIRSQAEPAPTGGRRRRGQHRFSLLPPGEGGPPGRMRVMRRAGPVRSQGPLLQERVPLPGRRPASGQACRSANGQSNDQYPKHK